MAKSADFHEHYEHEAPPLPSDRSTGLVFTGVALVLAWVWRHDQIYLTAALIAAGVLALISVLVPMVLRPLNIAWMKLAMVLNMVMSPVIMGVLFLVAIVPAGLIMQMRYDPLRKKRRADATSYWIERKSSDLPSSMGNQF
jgi:uncharacterized membrane protein